MQKKGSKKSVRRMKFLESYLEKLLKCDQSVTRSIEVTRFFTPKDHDLQPDYTKNRYAPSSVRNCEEQTRALTIFGNMTSLLYSVMMLLSDDQNDESGGGGGGSARHFHHGGSITHPFVTQTYHCVAAYETKDTKNRPFKVAKDEKLDVLIKDPAGQCFQIYAFLLKIIIESYVSTKKESLMLIFLYFISRLVACGE